MDNNELALMDRRMGEASVLSMEICDPHSNTLDARISQGDAGCCIPPVCGMRGTLQERLV